MGPEEARVLRSRQPSTPDAPFEGAGHYRLAASPRDTVHSRHLCPVPQGAPANGDATVWARPKVAVSCVTPREPVFSEAEAAKAVSHRAVRGCHWLVLPPKVACQLVCIIKLRNSKEGNRLPGSQASLPPAD